jgi:4-hydroxybenzoate polyprenyltransferase
MMLEKIGLYAQLIRFDRPIGTYLLLWPTLWALWIAAGGIPDLKILVIFAIGVFLMRSAGCAINDYADRHIDPHVERTKNRPLASGKITSKEALGVFAVLALCAFVLVLQLNRATILLSVVAVLLAASYPFMKRFHALPQVHLGAAFGWAVPMAFTATTGELPPLAGWLLFAATLAWTVAYDTMYAMADRDEDKTIGVKSTAILFGNNDRLIIGLLQVLTMLSLFIVGWLVRLGWIYYFGLLMAGGFFIYQQILIKNRDASLSLRAFLNNNWFGMIVFAGIAIDYFLYST